MIANRGERKLELPVAVWLALEHSVQVANCWTKNGKVHISLLENDFRETMAMFEPVYERRGRSDAERLLGYDIKPENCQLIKKMFLTSPKRAKVIAETLAENIYRGYPLPEELRMLGYGLMSRHLDFPRPKPVKPSLTHRDTLLVGLAKSISRESGIPLGTGTAALSSADSLPISGATIAAAALHPFGVKLTATQASKVVYAKTNIVSDLDLRGPIFRPNFRQPGLNALASFGSSFPLEDREEPDLKKELEVAVAWLGSPN